MNQTINTSKLKLMFKAGTDVIAKNVNYINDLNVFPVPDGDTGINLKITTSGAWEEIKNSETTDLSVLTKNFAHGLFMNARGNSGVIFSQIFKGFSSAFKNGQKTLSIDDLIKAFTLAKNAAYKAVSKPIEGTILTIIRCVAEQIQKNKTKFKYIEDVFEEIYKVAKNTLAQTPKMLQELKDANVVDSGGCGLTFFLKGMKKYLINGKHSSTTTVKSKTKNKIDNKHFIDNNDGFGYCTEILLDLGSRISVEQSKKDDFNESNFKKKVKKMGDSFVYAKDGNIVKVHIHLFAPYKLLEYASKYGEFKKIKITNMTEQFFARHKNLSLEKLENNFESKINNEIKIAATVPSKILSDFYSNKLKIKSTLNCEEMGNPTIGQFYELIKSTNTKNVFLVTNDGNTIMAAEQAISLFPKKTYNIQLIPAVDIATSYLICLSFDPYLDFDTNYKNMYKIFKNASFGKVSFAAKDTKYRDVYIKINDFIGVMNKSIVASGNNCLTVSKKLIQEVLDEIRHPKTIAIIYGIDAKEEETKKLFSFVKEKYKITPILINGGQATYRYYISATK